MADPLYELLAPYFDNEQAPPSPRDPHTNSYLTRLSTLSLGDLTLNEPASLLHSAQSHLRSLQALSRRSRKAVISSTSHLDNLSTLLPDIGLQAQTLSKQVPDLENAATEFADKYDRSTDNAVLDRRKQAALLFRNVDKVSDVLDLPSLLSSTVAAAQAGTTSTSSSTTSYASALDLQAHIKRLKALYPHSDLVSNIALQAEGEIENLASILILSLQSPSLKLAAAMRTIGWLRRVAPDLAGEGPLNVKPGTFSTKSLNLSANAVNNDGALGSLFLVCRLKTLHDTLNALDPLRDLADAESLQRERQARANGSTSKQSNGISSSNAQSERFLKRYIEIFREQSFNILSMYKSIFPANFPEPDRSLTAEAGLESRDHGDSLLPLPSPISTFTLHLVDMLESTLRQYMPNVVDKGARESLLTQVLYCAGSLGRLGADFGILIAVLESDPIQLDEDHTATPSDGDKLEQEPEWVQVMKKHRIQASRLEVLARGVGTSRKVSMDVVSPGTASPTTAA